MRPRTPTTPPATVWTPIFVLLALLAALPAGCTRAYMDALEQEMSLAPRDRLGLRAQEAREGLDHTRTALLHLGDKLRDLSVAPLDDVERADTDLRRRAEQLDTAAWDARRQIASVHDVAPEYLRPATPDATQPPPRPSEVAVESYNQLASSLDAADRSLLVVIESLRAELPTLTAAPSPGTIGALRGPIVAALADTSHAIEQIDLFLQTLQ